MPWLGRPPFTPDVHPGCAVPAAQGRIPGAGTGPSSLQAFCSRTRAPCPPGGGSWEELTRESGPLGAGWADEEARLGSPDGVSTERRVVGGAEGQNRRDGWGGGRGKF